MARKNFLFTCILLCLVGGPYLWADAEASVEETKIPEAELTEKIAQVEGTVGVAMTVTAAGDVEEAGAPLPSPATPPAERSEVGIQLFENLLEAPTQPLAGCSAWYPCVHGGSVSCSAPTGTCISSGQGCGLVDCNGNTTFCPGGCNTDWSCATFCYTTYGSMDGYCDSLKCCVCL